MKIRFETRVFGENLVEITLAIKDALDAFFGSERDEMPGDIDISLVKTISDTAGRIAGREYEAVVTVRMSHG